MKLTDSASNKVKELQAEEGTNQNLRIFIEGGGCSGFQYGFKWDDATEEDFKVEMNGATILVDVFSHQYLTECSVDYVERLSGSMFVIKNPSAVSTCGCGSSFGV